jgi:hypothetical protein
MSTVLCIVLFLGAFVAGRKALWLGISAVLTVGFFYGIARANLGGAASHFLFDAALVGLYLAVFSDEKYRNFGAEATVLQSWVLLLGAWVFVLLLLPLQEFLVRFIGVRTTLFYVLALLVGARMKNEDVWILCRCVAVLCCIAMAVAVAEYLLGIERFFPRGPTTQLIYLSTDVAGGHFRIPATFSSSHSYGGVMVFCAALLGGALFNAKLSPLDRQVMGTGLIAAVLGVFICAARTPVAFLLFAAMFLSLIVKMRPSVFASIVTFALIVGYGVLSSERFQRFTTLFDADAVARRAHWSANETFLSVLLEYPFGNGLGGSGAGVPYFMQEKMVKPLFPMENEYARLVNDLGWIGLLIFMGFVIWMLLRGGAIARDEWRVARRLIWFVGCCAFVFAFLGTGLLFSIPGAFLMFVLLGFALTEFAPVRKSRLVADRRAEERFVALKKIPEPENDAATK